MLEFVQFVNNVPEYAYDRLTEYSFKVKLLKNLMTPGDSDLQWTVGRNFKNQMKINNDTINFFKSLYWDYQVSEENIITIIESGEWNGLTRKNLLSRALKSRRWYEIKKILSAELLKEALSEDVLKTLFPKSLSRQYNYVKKLLYQ